MTIVIGAGSAGSVVASRPEEPERRECCSKRVVLIPNQKFKFLSVYTLRPEVDWAYSTEREPFLNNRKIFSSRGKVLGGSSSINGMIYIRGNSRNYNSWQALGNQGWSPDVLPYFKKSENQQRGASLFHGLMDHLASQIHSSWCRNALWKPRSHRAMSKIRLNGVQQVQDFTN